MLETKNMKSKDRKEEQMKKIKEFLMGTSIIWMPIFFSIILGLIN